jgi:crossover junction endodeoxyribonuclease RuvC
MRIIGIDPGTGILGFGVIDVVGANPSLVDAGVIRTPSHQELSDRLITIYDELDQIIRENKPDIMVVEQLFFAQNVTTAMSVAHARGVVLLLGKKHNLVLIEKTPLQIKQTITGYGRATKAQMQEMVRVHLKLNEIPKPDDCADALAAALCGF